MTFKQNKVLKNIRGAAQVELALIAIPLFILIIGTLQNVLISIARLSLDSNLQALTYEAANSNDVPILTILNRQNLCSRKGFYLVDCEAGLEFCFALIALDQIATQDLADLSCTSGSSINSNAAGVFALVVEYPVPNYLYMPDLIAATKIIMPKRLTIRSVALYYSG